MGEVSVLRKLWLAECVFVTACFLFSISIIIVMFSIMPCWVYQYNCFYCVIFCCVAAELIIPHKIRLFEFRRLKELRGISCEPSDRHLVTLPLWLATWGPSTKVVRIFLCHFLYSFSSDNLIYIAKLKFCHLKVLIWFKFLRKNFMRIQNVRMDSDYWMVSSL